MTGPITCWLKAINDGLRKSLEDDPKVVIMGEDVGRLGGVFRVTDGPAEGLRRAAGIDTPWSESGHHRDGRRARAARVPPGVRDPVRRLHHPGRATRSSAQAAEAAHRPQGALRMPVTIRIPFGGGIRRSGAPLASPRGSYFAHTAGLKVVACASPSDGYWMIQQRRPIRRSGVFFEPKRGGTGPKRRNRFDQAPPLGRARIVRPGQDVTVVAYGPDGWRHRAGQCRQTLAAEEPRTGGHRPAQPSRRSIRPPWSSRCPAPVGLSSSMKRLCVTRPRGRGRGSGAGRRPSTPWKRRSFASAVWIRALSGQSGGEEDWLPSVDRGSWTPWTGSWSTET